MTDIHTNKTNIHYINWYNNL